MTLEDGPGTDRPKQSRPRHTARELKRYEALFAGRTACMRSSAMRDMFALTERPDVISLAGGLPDTSTFPPELFAKLMSRIAVQSTARALQYGPTDGMKAAVQSVIGVMAAEGTIVDAEDIMLTTGGQQVLDLVCKTFIDPGDVIVAEAPTYPGAIPAFASYQADVRQVEMDGQGMPTEALVETLERLEREGRRPKLIYTIPNFQNPGGVTMSLERRKRLIEIARERELLILEDNPYGLLRYEGRLLPSLYSLDASTSGRGGASDFVVYLGSFSKILSPGVRLGWAVAPRPVLEKMNIGKQGTDLCSSSVSQLFVAEYFAQEGVSQPFWIEHLDRVKAIYKQRRDVMLEALEEQFEGAGSWNRPQGGLFVWATLDRGFDTTDLLARSEKVAFVPGRAAFMDARNGASSMRLNFAGSSEDEIREGIRRIGDAMRAERGLMGALSRSGKPAEPAGAAEAAGRRSPGADREPEAGDAAPMAEVLELPRRARRGDTKRREG